MCKRRSTARWIVLPITLLLAVALQGQDRGFRWPAGAKAGVVLTYDDGIDAQLDNAIPDLDAAHLRGTFFLPGNSESLRRRMQDWRAIARRGHELGSHTLFHACLGQVSGQDRRWVAPEWALENSSVPHIVAEIGVMNVLLSAVDGQHVRTFAYPCGDEVAGGASYVDAIHPLFRAARAYRDGVKTSLVNPWTVDPYRVPARAVDGDSATDMIAWVEEAISSGKLAVFAFHGVGGGHSLNVAREEHRKLLTWLDANRGRVWTAPFLEVMGYIAVERKQRISEK